jgi:acyl dehydratase
MTISEADDHQFCLLTMAVSPIHVDAHYARSELQGGRNLVVGTYIYALLEGMRMPDVSARAIGSITTEYLSHSAPMYHGETLYGVTSVTGARSAPSPGEPGVLAIETTGVNQDGLEVCKFGSSLSLPRRSGEVLDGTNPRTNEL